MFLNQFIVETTYFAFIQGDIQGDKLEIRF